MSSPSPRKSRAPLLIGLACLAITATLAYWLISSKPTPPVKESQETAWLVDTETLKPRNIAPELTLLGTVQSNGLALISSRINADVLETPFLVGSAVEAGDILLRLEPTDARATLSQREADVQDLNARIAEEKLRQESDLNSLETEKQLVALAEKSLSRQNQLTRSKVSSEERRDTAETALAQQKLALANRTLSVANHRNRLTQLEAQLKRAEALLQLAELDFAQTELKAPFAGRITALHTAPGNRVRIGDRLIELLAENSLEVVAQVPNRWVGALQDTLRNDQEAVAYADVFGRRVPLSLERLAASANERTAGVNAFFSAQEEAGLILGKSINVTLELPALPGVFSAPQSALYGDDRIFVVEEERLKPARIERQGRYRTADGERLLFTSDELQAGQLLVTTQLPNAVSGLKVRLRESAPETQTAGTAETAGEDQ